MLPCANPCWSNFRISVRNCFFPILICSFHMIISVTAHAFPLNINNCDRSFTLKKPPQRAIAIDINQTEIMLKLGLAASMIGMSGVAVKHEILPELQAEYSKVPTLSNKYPSLEAILSAEPDFVFAGWQYGFSETSGVTPARLAELNITSYANRESCIRIMGREAISLEDPFQDILAIARIFGVEARAEALVKNYRKQIAELPPLPAEEQRPRVFLYDSGEQTPFTAGAFAIPNAQISLAGGRNIFADVATSWTHVSWEAVIARQPELIIIVDYDSPSAEEKWRFLQKRLHGHQLPAITSQSYLALPYAAVTPGIRNVEATIQISQAIQEVLQLRTARP